MKTNIVMVKYEDNFCPRVFQGKEYSYYTDQELSIGNLAEVPTKYGLKISMITKIDVPETEIEKIKPYMKTITRKIDKDRYINFAEVREVA